MSLLAAYRRTGAELPFADPARPHGVAMDGSYWRFTDAASGRVVVVLRGDCLAADGSRWALVALAAHPGGVLRWAIADRPGVIEDAPGRLRVRLDGAELDATWSSDLPWPRRAFGGLGPAQAVPWLGQYWHPHLLLGRTSGSVTVDGVTSPLDGATAYAERNWGSVFAGHWWWGQAHGLGDGAACVAFAGGRMLGGAPTAVVVALEGEVLRLAPPLAAVTVAMGDGRWHIRARGPRHAVEVSAEADPATAHVLPVPVPGERRAILRSSQHLAGRLAITVRRGRGVVFRGETELAGLERGVPG